MRSNTAYLALFLIAALVAAVGYGVIGSLLPWETEHNELAYGFFFLTAALAALAVGAISRRWDWFLVVMIGGLLLPAVIKALDDLTGRAITTALAGTGLTLVLKSLLYGLLTALGAILGFRFMAGRRTARRTRL
jgi:hypothetical protein